MATARGRELLTPDQWQEILQIPEDDWALGTYYTFSNQDLKIINKRRREENRLGFAIQLAVLRFPGWPYTHTKAMPERVVNYIAGQLEANPDAFSQYPQRENTLWDHVKDIRTESGFVNFTTSEYRSTYKHLMKLALVEW
jgi:TnpA family transposase